MTPPDSLYGADTVAALNNFGVSGRPVPRPIVTALAHIKAAAALANAEEPGTTGVTRELAEAIVDAADQIIAGEHWDQFPVDVYQTGSGTSTHMNLNEVLATLAGGSIDAAVHPNDHVNASQSTNDVFPTALRLASLERIKSGLMPALRRLEAQLADKANAFDDVVKPGRTHMMDATPVLLGDEFAGYRHQVSLAIERLQACESRLVAVPLGGTAVGNGLNTTAAFRRRVVELLRERTDLPLIEAPNRFAAQGSQDDLVELSAQLRGTAVALYKIANDVRFMASGPRTGLGELRIPKLQPGSSIMPGKVNPVICEVVLQVAARVIGNDATIGFAGTQGNLELNVFLPLIGLAALESIELLAAVALDFGEACIAGLEADAERCLELAEASPAIATALNPVIGYDAATELVGDAISAGTSIEEAAVAGEYVSEAVAAEYLDVHAMARGEDRPAVAVEDRLQQPPGG